MQGGGSGEGAWSQAKTGAAVGLATNTVSKKVAFAKLLRARPDLKALVKQMPESVAMRVVEQKQEAEKVERLAKGGKLKLSTSLRLGDCRELIKGLAGASVDLILTDPPFGISTLDEMEGEGRGTVQSYTTILKPQDNATLEEVGGIFQALAPEMQRVLKPGGHFYIFFASEAYSMLVPILKAAQLIVEPVPLVWDKGRTTAPFRGYNYSPSYEPILFGHRAPRIRRLNVPARDILTHTPDSSQSKRHPFQKPMSLLRFLINQSTKMGDVVLDPFAGSGSTIRAARELGRIGIGFELDGEHFHKAQGLLVGEGEE
jgi:site-specific DNA-methyltransferase (adenine-specific)